MNIVHNGIKYYVDDTEDLTYLPYENGIIYNMKDAYRFLTYRQNNYQDWTEPLGNVQNYGYVYDTAGSYCALVTTSIPANTWTDVITLWNGRRNIRKTTIYGTFTFQTDDYMNITPEDYVKFNVYYTYIDDSLRCICSSQYRLCQSKTNAITLLNTGSENSWFIKLHISVYSTIPLTLIQPNRASGDVQTCYCNFVNFK